MGHTLKMRQGELKKILMGDEWRVTEWIDCQCLMIHSPQGGPGNTKGMAPLVFSLGKKHLNLSKAATGQKPEITECGKCPW